MRAYLVQAALVAAAVALAPPRSSGRLRRDGIAGHLERASIVDELSVIDPASGLAWTGLSPDGDELDAMPGRLRVSFVLHGEHRTLDVARSKTLVSPNYRELVLEIPTGQTMPSTQSLSGLLKVDIDGGRRVRRRAGPRRRRASLDCFYHGQVVDHGREQAGSAGGSKPPVMGGGIVSLSACELPLKIHATVFAPNRSESFEIQPLEDGGHVAYHIDDLKDSTPAGCGVDENDPHAHTPPADKDPAATDEHWAFKGNMTGRSRRQNCAKTVCIPHRMPFRPCPCLSSRPPA